MRKIILAVLLAVALPVFAKTADSKDFSMNPDKAFVSSLETLKNLNFEPVVMQSDTGYIFFKTPADQYYLLMVSDNGDNTSNIKIMQTVLKSPLSEIQDLIYTDLNKNLTDTPAKEAE